MACTGCCWVTGAWLVAAGVGSRLIGQGVTVSLISTCHQLSRGRGPLLACQMLGRWVLAAET